MLKFYIISTVICFLVTAISLLAMATELKREGYKSKIHYAWIEILQASLILYVPVINIVLALYLIFQYNEVLTKVKSNWIREDKP